MTDNITQSIGSTEDTSQPRKPTSNRRWTIGGAVAVVVVVAWILGGNAGDQSSTSVSQTRLELAQELVTSAFITVGDDGHTMIIDGEGDESPGAPIEQIALVLSTLDTSTAVVSRMDSTRALDGTQEGSWDGFTASWTYHPDDGLDIIIVES